MKKLNVKRFSVKKLVNIIKVFLLVKIIIFILMPTVLVSEEISSDDPFSFYIPKNVYQICKNKNENSCNKKFAKKYWDKKGRLILSKPLKNQKIAGSTLYEAKMENGDTIYISIMNDHRRNDNPIFFHCSRLIPLEDAEEAFQQKGLYLGTQKSIYVEQVFVSDHYSPCRKPPIIYLFSNGYKAWTSKYFKKVKNFVPNLPIEAQEKYLSNLTSFHLDKDDFEESYNLRQRFEDTDSFYPPVSLSIKFYKNGVLGRVRFNYMSDDAIYVKQAKIKTEEGIFEIETSFRELNIDVLSSGVLETFSRPLDDLSSKIIRAIISSEDPVIRFVGRKFYDNKKFNVEQKASLKLLLELYDLAKLQKN